MKSSGKNRETGHVALPAQPNLSLMNGLECLHLLVSMQKPMGSRELARHLNMEHTRTNRLLGTLAYLELVERTNRRKYTLGAGLHVLAAMSLRGSRLLTCALPHLHALMEKEKNLSVALGVLWRSYVCYQFFATPGSRVEESIANRDPCEAERSSIGQVLLAFKPAGEIRNIYRQRRSGRPTETEVRDLLRRLKIVRARGYAMVNTTSLGVTVGNPPFAGLALAGELKERNIPALVRRLREAAGRIAADMEHG